MNMIMTLESMMNNVIEAYGHESKEAIWFCNGVESKYDWLDIAIMYNRLMKGREHDIQKDYAME